MGTLSDWIYLSINQTINSIFLYMIILAIASYNGVEDFKLTRADHILIDTIGAL